jgi:diphthamide biosynthesis enzyme Dph1/Dph2-like protein
MKLYELKTFLGNFNVLLVDCNYRKLDKEFVSKKLLELKPGKKDVVLLIECFSNLKSWIEENFEVPVLIIGGCTPRELLNRYKRKILIATGNFYLSYYSGIPETYLIDPIQHRFLDIGSIKPRWCYRRVSIEKFKNSYVALVVSLKSGQMFPLETLEALRLRLKAAGAKSVDIIIFRDNVTEEALYNFSHDYYILTACPRFLDDLDESLRKKVFHLLEIEF